MKVRELQELLSRLDPELEVICYCEDEDLLAKDREFTLFDILEISTTEVERLRLKDGSRYLKFDRGTASQTIAMLEITSDF